MDACTQDMPFAELGCTIERVALGTLTEVLLYHI